MEKKRSTKAAGAPPPQPTLQGATSFHFRASRRERKTWWGKKEEVVCNIFDDHGFLLDETVFNCPKDPEKMGEQIATVRTEMLIRKNQISKNWSTRHGI